MPTNEPIGGASVRDGGPSAGVEELDEVTAPEVGGFWVVDAEEAWRAAMEAFKSGGHNEPWTCGGMLASKARQSSMSWDGERRAR